MTSRQKHELLTLDHGTRDIEISRVLIPGLIFLLGFYPIYDKFFSGIVQSGRIFTHPGHPTLTKFCLFLKQIFIQKQNLGYAKVDYEDVRFRRRVCRRS
jgi:hypothetical protein